MKKKDIREILLTTIPIALTAIIGVMVDVLLWVIFK